MSHVAFHQIRIILRGLQYPVEYLAIFDVIMGYAAYCQQNLETLWAFQAKCTSGTEWTENDMFKQDYEFYRMKIRGVGNTVEIDESKVGAKRKYRRERVSEGPWVFGAIERGTQKVLLFRVPDRTRETLVHRLITSFIRPGTVIYSHQFTPYIPLSQLGYIHLSVNHSENFVDPDSGAHTNTNSWLTVVQLSTDSRPTVGLQSANCRPMCWRTHSPMHWLDLIHYHYPELDDTKSSY